MQALDERGIGFKSVQESIDTTTPGGKLVFHVFGALAEFERDLIRERTNAGLAAARARGRTGGRKPILDAKGREVALALFCDKSLSVTQICKTPGVSRTTFYRYLPDAVASEAAACEKKGQVRVEEAALDVMDQPEEKRAEQTIQPPLAQARLRRKVSQRATLPRQSRDARGWFTLVALPLTWRTFDWASKRRRP